MTMRKGAPELIRELLGTPTRPVENPEAQTSIGTTAVLFLRNNPNRLGFTAINLSTANLFILFDSAVSSSRGIFLTPNGGGVNFIWNEDYHWVTYDWYVVASAVTSAFHCTELVTS